MFIHTSLNWVWYQNHMLCFSPSEFQMVQKYKSHCFSSEKTGPLPNQPMISELSPILLSHFADMICPRLIQNTTYLANTLLTNHPLPIKAGILCELLDSQPSTDAFQYFLCYSNVNVYLKSARRQRDLGPQTRVLQCGDSQRTCIR